MEDATKRVGETLDERTSHGNIYLKKKKKKSLSANRRGMVLVSVGIADCEQFDLERILVTSLSSQIRDGR